MIERDPQIDPNQRNVFSFVCPPGREGDVLVVLDDVKGLMLAKQAEETVRIIPNKHGIFEQIRGIEITGTCSLSQRQEIVEALAKNRIAGYSRVTQVLFHKLEQH